MTTQSAYKIPRMLLRQVDIPSDIISLILRELPVKSLLKFRCVSKNWLCLIDDPHFVEAHRLRSHHRFGGLKFLVEKQTINATVFDFGKQRREFMLMDPEDENMTRVPNPNPSLDLDSEGPIVRIGESVEGLTCIGDVVWNPSTRKAYRFPPQHLTNIDISIGPGGNLPFINNSYYLGFDVSTKQYKVLSICRVTCFQKFACNSHVPPCSHHRVYSEMRWSGKFYFQVITLGTTNSQWRDITPAPSLPIDLAMGNNDISFYFKNEIFILVRHTNLKALMIFSVGEEKLKFVRVPRDFDERKIYKIVAVRGCVALMTRLTTSTEIWRLIDVETEKWEKNVIYATNPKFNEAQIQHPRDASYANDVVCIINDKDVLVQSNEKNVFVHKRFHYWDTKKRSQRSVSKILSKHVETLFDPNNLP